MNPEIEQNERLRKLIRQELINQNLESVNCAKLGLGKARVILLDKIISGEIYYSSCETNDVLRYIAKELNSDSYESLKLPENNLYSESEFVSYDPAKNGLNIVKHGIEFHAVHSYSNGTFGRLMVPTGDQSSEKRYVIFSKYKVVGSKSPYLPEKFINRDEIFLATIASPRGGGFRFISSSILSSDRKKCEDRVVAVIKDVVDDEGQMEAIRLRSMEILDGYFFS